MQISPFIIILAPFRLDVKSLGYFVAFLFIFTDVNCYRCNFSVHYFHFLSMYFANSTSLEKIYFIVQQLLFSIMIFLRYILLSFNLMFLPCLIDKINRNARYFE